jgi:hypothetical protein
MRSTGQFVAFLSIALTVVGAWQYYVWTRLVRDPGWPEPYGRIATVALVLMIILPPLVIFGARFMSRSTVGAMSAALYTWFGFAFLLTVAFFAADVARWLVRAFSWLAGDASPEDPDRRQLIARTVAGAAGATAAVLGAVSVRSALADVEVKEVGVKLDRLPPALSGLTIVQLTDVHIGPTIGQKFLEHIVEKTNAEKPDAIVITGDLSIWQRAASLRAHVEPLLLRARHTVSFVTATTNTTRAWTSGSPSLSASACGLSATSG